jgi:hypothetical protein
MPQPEKTGQNKTMSRKTIKGETNPFQLLGHKDRRKEGSYEPRFGAWKWQ